MIPDQSDIEHLFGEATQESSLRILAFDLTILVKTEGCDECTGRGGCIDRPLKLRERGYPKDTVLEILQMRPELANFLPENQRGQVHALLEHETIVVAGAHFSAGDMVVNQRTGEVRMVESAHYTYQVLGSGMEPQSTVALSASSSPIQEQDTLVATKALRYALMHQVAHCGNTEAFKQLAELPGVDLGFLDAHGQSVLEIAKHRVDKAFLRDARHLMEERLQALLIFGNEMDPRRPSLAAALQGQAPVLHRGSLSNVMHAAGTMPAPVTVSAEFMCRCRASARLAPHKYEEAFEKCIEPDWLFAREELDKDPVLQKVKQYFERALPVHRTRHEALGNMLAGGALMGKKRLGDFVASLKDREPYQCEKPLNEMVAKAVFDLSEEIFWSLTAQDVPPNMRRLLSNFLTSSLRLLLCDRSDAANLPDGISVKGSLDTDQERNKLDQMREELCHMSEQWERNSGGAVAGAASPVRGRRGRISERKGFISNLEEEVEILCDGLLTFIKLCETGLKGVDFGVDAMFGTDMSLFATLGPNGNEVYGGVALAFRSDILAHPDTDMLPMAATLYRSKAALCMRRPWVATGMQEVPEQELPPPHAAGFNFRPLPPGPPRTVELLAGDACLSDLQGMYAWKMNHLNAGFSPAWAEVLAREHTATARLFLSGLRAHYPGQGQYRAAGDPYRQEVAAGKKWSVVQKDWTDPCPVQGDEVAWDKRITAEAIIDYYESCEGHAKVECHLPGVLQMQMVEHIWMTQEAMDNLVNHTDMTQKLRVGEMIASADGLVLPDGRMLRVVQDGPGWPWRAAPESYTLLTICRDNQELFDKQCEFMRTRLDSGYIERPISSFRTESGLRMNGHGVRWLPCLPGHGGGVAVSWMSNAGDGLEVAFAQQPFEGLDGDMYGVNIGKTMRDKYWNGVTQVFKKVNRVMTDVTVDARTSPKSMCATAGNGGGGCWQRYWAGISYSGGGAWVLFGRLREGEALPAEVKVTAADKSVRLRQSLGADGRAFKPEQSSEPLCLPALRDTAPLRDIRFAGFTCLSAPKLICRLEVHCAPAVSIV